MGRNSRRFLTARQAQEIDRTAKDEFGIDSLLLMENAGRQVAEAVCSLLGEKDSCVIVCGKGNNGADGLVTARHLLTRGIQPQVFVLGRLDTLSKEAAYNARVLQRFNQKIIFLESSRLALLKGALKRHGLVIDALLGIGLEGEVRGMYREAINIINASARKVLSIDIPSGLDATFGTVHGAAVKADVTVTFVAPKKGMLVRQGRHYCGTVVVADLGAPL